MNNLIFEATGYNRYYKGIICIHVDEWLANVRESHFTELLDFINTNKNKWLAVFNTHNGSVNAVESLERAISKHMNIQTLKLRFPDSHELVEIVEKGMMFEKGFTFNEGARKILHETIDEISKGEQFNGFKSIEQLVNNMMYCIMTKNVCNKKRITAEMLENFGKDSEYVKRNKSENTVLKQIGFISSEGKHERKQSQIQSIHI